MDDLKMEPTFQKIIQLAIENKHSNEIKSLFIEVVDGTIETPSSLLPYCMRNLKYEEVLEASKLKLGNPPDPRYMNFHSDLVHAFTVENWDEGFWEQQN